MSDAARPPPGAPTPAGALPRSAAPSTPPRVRSAARAQPLPPEPARPLQARVAGEAESAVLNGVAGLRALVADFRSQDRFFKYKAGILAAWLLLSATSIGIAWPSGGLRHSANLGARLVLAGDAQHPVYTLFNDGTATWVNVTVVANTRYRATAVRVPPGGNLTLTPSQLLGEDGQPAPQALQLRDLVVRSKDGDEVLMRSGQLQ